MRPTSILPLAMVFALAVSTAAEKNVQNGSIRLTLDPGNGSYAVTFGAIGWVFQGRLGSAATNVTSQSGKDRNGAYKEISFRWSARRPMLGSIRLYDKRSAVLFSETTLDTSSDPPPPFPVLRPKPSQLHMLTFTEREFGAPPVVRWLAEKAGSSDAVHSGPLVLFDDHAKTCIVSAASDFMVSSIVEGVDTSIASGLLNSLKGIPKGYTYRTLIVAAKGINAAWESWGNTMTDLHGKKRPSNEADAGLRYLGYWTDNGATYYYNYDTTKGYEGTLVSELAHLDSVHIPIRYLQLDSWWYLKGFTPPDGKVPEHPESKVPSLPAGEWNRYGGLIDYVPSPALFPKGLKVFRDRIGIPLITHNRWIERESPYRHEYAISGIGAVDPRWWNMIASNLAWWGVQTYEQDWQNYIYRYSPEFFTTTWAADKFFDGMAEACARHGLTMQYCMSLPRCYLQGGAKYSNLTTIRVSGDRFERAKWKEFLYGSRLASALGVWPWADVFMSSERDNLLLATLSGGMVGIGDAYGSENPKNIAWAVRPDGVIVKPDAALVPTDQTVLADAMQASVARTAFTFTDTPGSSNDARAVYLFSSNDEVKSAPTTTRPSDLGLRGKVFVYDFFAQKGKCVQATDSLPPLEEGGVRYAVLAPVDAHGIALIGDPGKFVTRGRERISAITPIANGISVAVTFSSSEAGGTMAGYARTKPEVSAKEGKVEVSRYDDQSGQFLLTLRRAPNARVQRDHGDAVAAMTVEIRTHP